MTKDIIDLDNIKGIIEKTKKENKERAIALGEDVTVHLTGDVFLNELQTSLVEGALNPSSAKVVAVNEAIMVKDGERTTIDPKLMEHIGNGQTTVNVNPQLQQEYPQNQPSPQYQQQQQQQEQYQQLQYAQPIQPTSNPDQNFYAEIERKQRELATLQGHGQVPQTGKPVMNEQYIATPNALNEQISIAFDNFLKEDLSTVLQEAMKSSIVETYKAERVKIALQENKNLIRTIVLDVIKELQERNPKKKS